MSGQQLEDRFARMAEGLPDPPARPVGEIRARARRRRVWRRAAVAVAVVPVLVLSGMVAVELLASRAVPSIEPAAPGQGSGLELADGAVWISPTVSGVEEAARLFAAAALAWDDPTIELGTDEPGPVWITMSTPEGGVVEALFTPYLLDGAWQILQVGTDFFLEQTFNPPGVTLTRVPAGAVVADLYVRVDGRTWHGRVDANQLTDRALELVEFGGPSEGSIASNLVVLRDRDGQVVTATGGHYGDLPAIPAPAPLAELAREDMNALLDCPGLREDSEIDYSDDAPTTADPDPVVAVRNFLADDLRSSDYLHMVGVLRPQNVIVVALTRDTETVGLFRLEERNDLLVVSATETCAGTINDDT